jgi:hypothetical protein
MAADCGHEAVVRLLLEHKASVDAAKQVVTRIPAPAAVRPLAP